MVAFIDSNSVPPIPSRARPRVQGSTFAAKHRTVHQEPSLTRSVSHFKARQGKSTSSPKKLHRVDHSNQQYSILAISNTSGAVVERVAYQAYGQPTFMNAAGTTLSSSAKATRYSYTGREWDASLKLHHFRARWMSGVSGRFLGRDPIGYLDGLNSYSVYIGLNYLDSFGLCKCCCCAEDLKITNDKMIDDDFWGRSFDAEALLLYKPSGVEGDCKLEWWETSNIRPKHYVDKGIKPWQWVDGYEVFPHSPAFDNWNRRAKPCPDYEKVVVPDAPTLSKWRGVGGGVTRTVKKLMTFHIIIKSAPDCPCVKKSVSVTASLLLTMENSVGVKNDFDVPAKYFFDWPPGELR